MKKEENIENEFLKELSPLLFDKRIALNAEPPEGYFEDLNSKIKSKIYLEEAKENRGGSKVMQFVNFRNLAIAAGIAVIIALIPFFKSNDIDQNKTSELVINSETTLAELNEYVDESDLYSAFDEHSITNFTDAKNLNDEEIINYLMREDYNEELLIEIR